MTWMECFEKYGYYSLLNYETDDIEPEMEFFLENGEIPNQLREIYLSKYRDELFLILQPDRDENVKKFCQRWDNNIMAFINFGSLPNDNRESIKKLRYNIVQVILYGIGENINGVKYMNEPDDFSEEKSTSVSRKIFIKSNDADELDEENKILLPFWYDEFEKIPENMEAEQQLKRMLPDEYEVATLYQEHEKVDMRKKENEAGDFSYKEDEFESIKRWLCNDEN